MSSKRSKYEIEPRGFPSLDELEDEGSGGYVER